MVRLLLAALVAFGLSGCVDQPDQGGSATEGSFVASDPGGDRLVAWSDGLTREVSAPPFGLLERPAGVTQTPDGALWIASFGSGAIVRNAEGVEDVHFVDRDVLEEPVALAWHEQRLYVAGNDTSNVVVLDRDGDLLANLSDPWLRQPHDLAFGPGGELVVATSPVFQAPGAVQVRDPASGEVLRWLVPPDEVFEVQALAFDGDELLVADWHADRILRYDFHTGERLDSWAADGWAGPQDLAVDADGGVVVGCDDGVVHLGPDGSLRQAWTGPPARGVSLTP